ncbi:coiled-coil domain-containing protein 138 isoform X2 [Callorhinchus milii]|uniref:coiled-coil domain-containing protein 138 isoform X2 n=1 Tax=Callorhinchus milii TaxID=7868 RepID=UPI001C3F978B|nr:coiled-coil domain-containing protein 138 isoform X2 [Callorhinchus milii]
MGSQEEPNTHRLVERLKRRALTERGRGSALALLGGAQDSTLNGTRISLNFSQSSDARGRFDMSSEKIPSSGKLPASGLTYSERKHYNQILHDLCKRVITSPAWVEDAYESANSDQATDDELSEEEAEKHTVQDTGTQFYTETGQYSQNSDVTLPSNLAATTVTSAGVPYVNDSFTPSKRNASFSESLIWKEQGYLPPDIMKIYDELTFIHQKLQESAAVQESKRQVIVHEQHLTKREALLLKHQVALTKLRGVEEEVHAKFQIMKEQHAAEVSQLTDALKEKMKENKRLKSSFDTLKELNDSLKTQINDVSKKNKKMETQGKKVQNRLENLQRKNELAAAQKSRENIATSVKEIRPEKQDMFQQIPKMSNRPAVNSNFCELLGILLDWITDSHLCHSSSEDDGNSQRAPDPSGLPVKYIQDKCAKTLPLLTEQVHSMPPGNAKLQLTLVRFIYWALKHMDRAAPHTTIISTMRRLGEELYRGAAPRLVQENPSDVPETKPKTSAFFRSSDLNIRFLSTLSILKTITQVDIVAQAFDTLHMDLKIDGGKALFLEHRAIPIILVYLKPSSKGLLSSAVDIFLQMTMESRYLQSFLEACSNETWFRTCSLLLRYPKLEWQILEKLSVILQKLSKIKSNKKLFELFTIHILIQELHRTTDPEHTFLAINLQSILFNLGMIKGSTLTSNLNTSHLNH